MVASRVPVQRCRKPTTRDRAIAANATARAVAARGGFPRSPGYWERLGYQGTGRPDWPGARLWEAARLAKASDEAFHTGIGMPGAGAVRGGGRGGTGGRPQHRGD